MNFRLFCFFCFLSGSISAQELSGFLLDKTTKKPVPECLVIVKGTTRSAITGNRGEFSIPYASAEMPPVLVFTMLGYVTIEYPCATYKKDTFYIASKNVQLHEVVIAADKKNILNPNSQETVLDFDLMNDHLLVLSAAPGKNNLRLMDDNGKTITSLKVDPASANLKHDCIGNLQLFGPDSVWQVFYDYTKLNALPPFSLPVYNQVMGNCVCSGNKTYYFRNMKYRKLRTEYFYYNENEKGVRHELAKFQDTAKIKSFELDYNLQYFLTVRRKSHFTMYNEPLDDLKKHLEQYREELPLDWSYNKWLGQVNTQMVKVDTELFLVNFTDSVIYTVNKQNAVLFNSGFKAMQNKNVLPNIYVDEDYRETYLIQFLNNVMTAVKFDIHTGNVISKTEIANVPYLPKKIIINAGKAYFIQKNLVDEQAYKVVKYYLD